MIGLILVSAVDNTIAAAELLNTAAHYFAIFLLDMGAVGAQMYLIT